jgi:hypothetical protein
LTPHTSAIEQLRSDFVRAVIEQLRCILSSSVTSESALPQPQ